ncbi:MAG: MotA/TolQ/ExbB proton channel family protein [Gimesia sp.]
MSLYLSQLSGLSTVVITLACGAHLFFFFVLWIWSRRDLRKIASSLDDFTRGLKHRSLLDSTGHLSDQIEAFLADVNETLDPSANSEDRKILSERVHILDEKRRYLNSHFFETCYNICRTMIEAYPLAGVLGTILAMGAALQLNADSETTSTVNAIVSHFGDAIWSTFAGLSAAILLMFLNSILETSFLGLVENRQHVRDTVVRAKRELAFAAGGEAAQ